MDYIIILILLIIVVCIAIIIHINAPVVIPLTIGLNKISGGDDKLFDKSTLLLLPENPIFIFDGNNLVHELYNKHLDNDKLNNKYLVNDKLNSKHSGNNQLNNDHLVNDQLSNKYLINNQLNNDHLDNKHSNKKITPVDFMKNLKQLSDILQQSSYPIHIVIKNPDVNNDSKVKASTYIKDLLELSKQYPNITYHLAFDSKKILRKSDHHLKGRDDLLAIYLSTKLPNSYVVSHDKYKDFEYFKSIKQFSHFSINNGVKNKAVNINPIKYFGSIKEPNLGNQFTYEFIDNKTALARNIKNLEVYVDKPGLSSKMYLIIS